MPRGRHLRKIKLDPPDAAAARKYLLNWSDRRLYHHPERFPRLTAPALFGNGQPLILELGCGGGEVLFDLAVADPERNFLGVDVVPKVLYRAVRMAAAQALSNIRFIRANARLLYPLLEPATLEAVHLHFPDPHYRAKYRNRRLLDQAFLDQMQRALRLGGRLSIMTDEEPFFHDMLALLEADRRYEKTHQDRYLVGFPDGPASRYQRLWAQHGRLPLRVEVSKI